MNSYETYYPRPLLKRDSFFSLNGTWTLNGGDIEVPFPPESDLSGYKGELGTLHYEKEFSLPEGFFKTSDKVILHFGAVDQVCDVYLNENRLLHHEGGYLPFSVEITEYLQERNLLRVEAVDILDPFYPYGKQSKNPKGMWYTPVSGIWQSVWIEAFDRKGIDDIRIETDEESVRFQLKSGCDHYEISFPGYSDTFDSDDITIHVEDLHLWSPDDPHLYPVKISNGYDTIETYFALRCLEARKVNGHRRIFLNGKPLLVNGLLDQGYFEKGIFLPERPEDYEKDILNMKELGFNCLRKHIKIEPEAFYYYCDRHGMLVMQDMVNSGPYLFFSDTVLATLGLNLKRPIKDRKRYDFFLQHCKDTIEHLKSHPCIIAYTIYNEGWGQQDAAGTYEILKKLDPARLFDSTSGWFTDKKSDFDSYHIYFRNKVLQGGKNILALSECGGFIRDIAEHRSDKGSRWGYGSADSEEALTDKILEMHEKMVIPSIRNGLSLVVMTQISDVEGEINGLYTYDRSVCKVNKEKMKEANGRLQEVYENCCKE